VEPSANLSINRNSSVGPLLTNGKGSETRMNGAEILTFIKNFALHFFKWRKVPSNHFF